MPATARPARADVTECIPWLMALESVTQPGAAGRSVTPDPQPKPGAPRAVQTARSASAQRPQRSAAAGTSAPRWSMDISALRARRPVAEAADRGSPDAKALLPAPGQPGRAGQPPRKAVTDSASSMSGRGRTMRRTCDPSEVSLTPRKAAYLNSAADKVCYQLPKTLPLEQDLSRRAEIAYPARHVISCGRCQEHAEVEKIEAGGFNAGGGSRSGSPVSSGDGVEGPS